MRVLHAEDFKKIARIIVADYIEREVPLAEGLAKTSEDLGLNPDQIQNLVQLANTLAHLTLFENKNDGDKVVEFSPADPDSVMKEIYKEKPVPESDNYECEEMASPTDKSTDFFGDFPDLTNKLRDALTPSTADGEVSNEPADGASPRRGSMMIIKIRKVAAELKDRELASAFEYREELDKLASEFAKLYGPNLREFEKDALVFRGNAAIPVLTDIRTCLRIPEPVENVAFEKQAVVVDTQTKEMQSLDKLIKLAKDHDDYAQAHQFLQQKVGRIL